MLKKLYKYDLKNLSKILLPFSITLVGAGVICCLLFLLAGLVPESLKGLIMLPCILLIFGIFIGGIAGTLYPYLYYYQSFFTDKAYLTFVFPANIKTQLNAKILSGVTYALVTTLAMIFSIFLAFFGLFFVSGNLSSLKDIFVSLQEL